MSFEDGGIIEAILLRPQHDCPVDSCRRQQSSGVVEGKCEHLSLRRERGTECPVRRRLLVMPIINYDVIIDL